MTDSNHDDTIDHHGPMSVAEFLYAIGTAMGWPTEEDDEYVDEDAFRGDR